MTTDTILVVTPWSILLASCVTACGLSITGSAPDLTGDGGLPSRSGDGSTSGGPQTSADGASIDGGTDAARDGWCGTQPPHEICVDFDDGQIGDLSRSTINTAASTPDTSQSRSPPRSLRSAASSLGTIAYVFHAWGSARSSLDVAFDVLTEGTGYAQIGGFELFPATGYYQLFFEVDNGQLGFFEFVNGAKTSHPLAITVAGWHRLELHVDVTTLVGKSKLQVKQDGVLYFEGESASTHSVPPSVKADVGIVYSGKDLPVTTFIDNVAIDSKP